MSERIEVSNGRMTMRVVPESEGFWRERGFEKPTPRPQPTAEKPTPRRTPAAKRPTPRRRPAAKKPDDE